MSSSDTANCGHQVNLARRKPFARPHLQSLTAVKLWGPLHHDCQTCPPKGACTTGKHRTLAINPVTDQLHQAVVALRAAPGVSLHARWHRAARRRGAWPGARAALRRLRRLESGSTPGAQCPWRRADGSVRGAPAGAINERATKPPPPRHGASSGRPPRGFAPLPKPWIVERTHAWNDRPRHLAKHYDRSIDVATAWIRLVEARLLLRRRTTEPITTSTGCSPPRPPSSGASEPRTAHGRSERASTRVRGRVGPPNLGGTAELRGSGLLPPRGTRVAWRGPGTTTTVVGSQRDRQRTRAGDCRPCLPR
jgi:hypothetical protein